jgi:hypothetical protein
VIGLIVSASLAVFVCVLVVVGRWVDRWDQRRRDRRRGGNIDLRRPW